MARRIKNKPATHSEKEEKHRKAIKSYLKLIGILPPYKTSAMLGKLTRAQVCYLKTKFKVVDDIPFETFQNTLLFPQPVYKVTRWAEWPPNSGTKPKDS